MHPEIVSDEPGTCPECGMKLIAATPAPTSWTCPMHPEIVSDEPGTCPKCGMKLIAADGATGGEAHHDHGGRHIRRAVAWG